MSSSFDRLRGILGFAKTYNFILFIIFGGAILGFTLARLQYLDITGSYAKQASPGEWYWFRKGHYRVGITLHLATILPCSFLVVFQFIPAIRHRWITFHRVNGYLILLLLTLSNAGALMIARRSFGGTIETQTGIGVLVIITTIGSCLAYYNVKYLQLDQHRAWMLRTMFYMASIITLRLIMFLSALIISRLQGYYQVWSCDQLDFTYRYYDAGDFIEDYPSCAASAGRFLVDRVPVKADFFNKDSPAEIGASLQVPFGAALWLALFLHVVGIEIYLRLTPRESERLRRVSYERQLKAGFKNPGSAGLVVEKFGDAEQWHPPSAFDFSRGDGVVDTVQQVEATK